MQTLTVVGHVDEPHCLNAAVPESIRPGLVEIMVVVSSVEEDAAGAAGMNGIAQQWHDERNDPH